MSIGSYTGIHMLYKIKEQLCGNLRMYSLDYECAAAYASRDPDYLPGDAAYCANVSSALSMIAEEIDKYMEETVRAKKYEGETDYQILASLGAELESVVKSSRTVNKVWMKLNGMSSLDALKYAISLASAYTKICVYEWYRHAFTEAYADGCCSEAYMYMGC